MTDERVVLPRGIFTRRNNEAIMVRRPILDLMQANSNHVSKFKFEQQFYPDNSEARKLSAACSTCFPKHNHHLDEEVKISGIRNLFHIRTDNLHNSFFVRRFSSLFYVWETAGTSGKKIHVLNRKQILEDAIQSLGTNPCDKEVQSLKSAITKLVLPFTSGWGMLFFFRLTGWILRKFFGQVTDGICVHDGEIELLERALLTDLPVIYAPSNRSEFDPFVLYFTLQSLGLETPYFLSTSTQRYWGQFIGGLGLQNTSSRRESKSARNALSLSCLRNVLKSRGSICLQHEQKRTRTGKSSVELFGMEFLDEIYNYWFQNEIEDVYIVPVNVQYEHLPEHCITPAFTKSSGNVVKNIYNYLRYKLGYVRVGFGQPFTLREFKASVKENSKFNSLVADMKKNNDAVANYSKTFAGADLRWGLTLNPALSCSLSSLYDLEFHDDGNDEKYTFLDSLAFHIVFASTHSSTPMSTHFVAFLLLKKFRKGVSIHQLFSEVQQLKLWFVNYGKLGKDIGFTGDIEKAVLHALEILGPDTVNICTKDGVRIVQPILLQESLQKLGYYANGILQFMALEAVVAVALLAVIGNNMRVTKEFDVDHLQISDALLTGEVRRVYDTFTSEFFLHSPCLAPGVAIRKAYELLNNKDLIQSLLDETVRRSRGRVYETEMFDDGSDDENTPANDEAVFIPYNYKVCSSDHAYTTLGFLRDLLVPYLEIYAAIVLELECLINPELESQKFTNDYEFMNRTLDKLKHAFSIEDYGELLTMEILETSCLAFELHGIIYYRRSEPSRSNTIHLSAEYESNEQLCLLANNILHFVTY